MSSNTKGLREISGYSDGTDLKVVCEELKDKKGKAALIEFTIASLEAEFFKIKKQPYVLAIDKALPANVPSQCSECFGKYNTIEDVPNMYVDFEKSSISFCGFRTSSSVTKQVIENSYLTEYIENIANLWKVDIEKLHNWVVREANRVTYQFSIICGTGVALLHNIRSFFNQRLIVSSLELKYIKKLEDENFPVVFILGDESPYAWFILFYIQLLSSWKLPLMLIHKRRDSFFSWIMTKLGAVKIRPSRRGDKENSEKHVVYDETWIVNVEENLVAHNNITFSLTNNYGLYDLDLMYSIMDCVKRESVADISVVPVAIKFEQKAQNEDRFVSHSVFRKCMNFFKMGLVRVNFLKPFSLKTLMTTIQKIDNVAEMTPEQCFNATIKVMRHIDYDIRRATPLASTNVISFLLLRKFRSGVDSTELVSEVLEFKKTLRKLKVDLCFTGNSQAVVNHAISILGPKLVKINQTSENSEVIPVLNFPNVLETSHYAFQTSKHFLTRSVVFAATAQLCLSPGFNINSELKFSRDSFCNKCEQLCDILQMEYPFYKFCSDLRTEILEELAACCYDGFFIRVEKMMTEEERWGHRVAKHFDNMDSSDEDSDIEYNSDCDEEEHLEHSVSHSFRRKDSDEMYLMNCNSSINFWDEMNFHVNNLKVFMNAYLVSANHLFLLLNRQLPEAYYVTNLHDTVCSKVSSGEILFAESASIGVLKNTIEYFIKKRVIDTYLVNKINFFSLYAEYNSTEALNAFVEHIRQLQPQSNSYP